jgi:hypothetical protein
MKNAQEIPPGVFDLTPKLTLLAKGVSNGYFFALSVPTIKLFTQEPSCTLNRPTDVITSVPSGKGLVGRGRDLATVHWSVADGQ